MVARDPEPVRKHRDGHCHEGVMWYVHHLPELLKEVITDKTSLSLLSQIRHDLSLVKLHTVRVRRAYEEKVNCTSSREWESLNAKAEVARMHRHGHCHEAIVWYCPLENVCRSTLKESYRRATTQEPIIDGGSLVSPGLATQRDRGLTATTKRPDAVGWAPLVGQAR